MLHADNDKIKELLLKGFIGLEKEALRITPDGMMAHSPDPFKNEKHIVYDFCENQVEINTPAVDCASEAVRLLEEYTGNVQKKLYERSRRELLWPFSNPPYIKNEDDIPIARLDEKAPSKRKYRECLAYRYGKYKMSLSGIHINYSFDKELLNEDFKLSGLSDFREYKNALYVELTKGAALYGWIMTELTAASPLMDSSFFEKGVSGKTTFTGMASVRCSETGYWNYFTPVFDYSDVGTYADSIKRYVDNKMLISPSELYFPIRLKPEGRYELERLKKDGADHIELRMIDVNPYERSGIDLRDLEFAILFIAWLAGRKNETPDLKDQIQAAQNFKNAAHYDLKTVSIVMPDGELCSAVDAGLKVISMMKEYYREFSDSVKETIAYEEEKLADPNKRYAWRIRKEYAGTFAAKGLKTAIEQQRAFL